VKRSRLIAGAVAVIAAAGVWLGMRLSDLNFGAGGGTGIGLSGYSRPGDVPRDSSLPNAPKEGSKDGRGARRGDVLEVVIDGREYSLRQSGDVKDEYVPASLSEVITLAKETPGNRDGVRVRVYRKGSALPSAEEALQRALQDAGLGESAVQMMDGQLE
jgi:hypothetical protein